MKLRRQATTPAILSLAALLLSGCGVSSVNTQACSANILPDSATSGSDFKLSAVNRDLDIYPGGTATVQVEVQGSKTGETVTIGGQNLPHGVSIAPVTAIVGSTATLTVTATNDVLNSCFTGAYGVWTAAQSISLNGTDASGNSTTQVALNVSLENPNFVPATPSGLPILTISTVDNAPIASEDDYTDATITIVDTSNSKNNYTGTTGIKGHGHSTWNEPKKPYDLNLDNKAQLLGMNSATHWVLIANYDDKAMLRTDVSMEMSNEFGMFWTPSDPFIEVYLNGQYEGVYQLMEKVEVKSSRLNIGSMDDTDNSGTDLTGGYLGEIDHYYGSTFWFTDQAGLPINLADPDPPTDTQASYFEDAMNQAEGALYGPNFTSNEVGWPAYWDQASLVNWFLIEEITGNEDADDFSSDYFYKPRSDPRFYLGPVWDMDITFGNVNYQDDLQVNAPWVRTHSQWYIQLFKDPNFVAAVAARWAQVRPQVVALSSYLATRQATLTQAAANNYGRWPTLGEKVWPNPVATGSYAGEVGLMQSWLTARIAYMDATYQ